MDTTVPTSPLSFVIYDPTAKWPLVDSAELYNGSIYGVYSQQSLATMRQTAPACRLVSYGWAEVQMNEAAKTPVAEISLTDYEDALNVLPPAAWVVRPGAQTFHCCEMYTGNVSSIYALVGGRAFKFRDVVSLTHSERVARVVEWLKAH